MSTPIAQRIAEVPFWYHAIDLPDGSATPGVVDHRPIAKRVLPRSLTGLRALDVGTFDGFWAFELEGRGAQTVAIDVDRLDRAQWPPLNRARLEQQAAQWEMRLGDGFRLAHELRGSSVERVVTDVHDVTPEAIGGEVDVVFAGAIMLHLRDPVGAMERLLACLKPGGVLLQMEPFSWRQSLLNPRRPVASFEPLVSDFTWWMPNLSALKALPWAAGFVEVRRKGFVRPPSWKAMVGSYVVMESRRPRG